VFLLLISLDVSSWQLGFMLAPSKKKKKIMKLVREVNGD
jgi:hypothetical protein